MPKTYQRTCNTCNKDYIGFGKFYCSSSCQPRNYNPNSKSGAEHYNWKGNKASYHAKHAYLALHFGKANHCEMEHCSGKSIHFEWALKKGREYSHDPEDYLQLCKSCHCKYDLINVREKSRLWKGGRPKCVNCSKQLTNYKNKTGLCGLCNRKLNPPWLGKSRKTELYIALNKKQ